MPKKQFVLQHLVFPGKETRCGMGLYFQKEKGDCFTSGSELVISPGAVVNTMTYFNSFSYSVWNRYTGLSDFLWEICCGGCLHIELVCAFPSGEMRVVEQTVSEGGVSEEMHAVISIPEQSFYPGASYFLRFINASDRPVRICGGQLSGVSAVYSEVRLAVNICTYRRENYVRETLSRLKPLCDENMLEIFVSDNGATLDAQTLSYEGVHIHANKNTGGSGGFTRGILEALREKENGAQFSHILFMDDDIQFEPDSIYRTWCILTCLRPEYADYTVGGSLLRSDYPMIQHEKGAYRHSEGIIPLKGGYNLEETQALLDNERVEKANYNGWWYCCMPLSSAMKEDLPFPFFIHEDDQEYGMRRIRGLITMNGIGVWHDPFENRRASSLQYYDIRNMLVVNAIHEKEYTWKMAAKRVVFRGLLNNLLRYRYRDMDYNVRAVKDFCQGIDFFLAQDPQELNDELIREGYRLEDCDAELVRLGVSRETAVPARGLTELYEKEIPKTYKHTLTLNGWLFPDFSKKTHPLVIGAFPTMFYRKKRVLLYEPDTRKGICVQRRYRELFHFVCAAFTVYRLLRKNYERVAGEYRIRYREVTGSAFWEKYLS